MRKFWLFAIVIGACLLQACTVWGDRPVKTWSDVTGGESLERNFWREVKAKNWTELERHLAGNFVSASTRGTRDRAATVEYLKQLQLDEYSLGDFQVELNGQALVVNYSLTATGTIEGRPLPAGPVRMMSVWQQQKSGWTAIAHSTIGTSAN
jgi:hypothetical protein